MDHDLGAGSLFPGVASVQVKISARHGHLSEASREKISAKVSKLAKYFERLTAIEVTVNLEHAESPSIELLVSAEHKHDFVATDRAESLLAAVESVAHKVEQQIRKYKERIQEHRFASPGQLAAEAAFPPGEAEGQ
jgi:putative sigma-54 modulation protein